MSKEITAPSELVPALLREGRRHGVALATMFATIALAALAIGLLWPRTYSAATTILVQSSDIIQPLMEGRAVPTGNADRASLARQVVFSDRVMRDVLKTGGWLAANPSPVEQDRLIEQIKGRTQITSPRPELIQIAYQDRDRKRTFDVTTRMAELFIQESRAAKERESREAFEFIDNQVNDYHQKLIDAEDSLQKYRTANPDAQPGSAADVNSRIGALRSEVEQSRMTLMELQSSIGSLQGQLSGESSVTAVQTREGLYRAQLVDLQAQLDRLLLTYTDQYPDVVRTRRQMEDIKRQLASEQEQRRNDPGTASKSAFDNAAFNPHYLEIKRQLGEKQQAAAAARSRMGAAESMLKEEMERSGRIASSEGTLAELTRDYEVNRDIYQDLLKRRENARVSMVMDQEQRGLTLRIQDPAVMPLRPSGLRLTHFALAGIALALAVPIGLLASLVQFDPRLRSAPQIERLVGVPVLATIPVYETPRDRRVQRSRLLLAAVLVLGAIAAYVFMLVLRMVQY
ncbi:XrtA system polysaccharide chain length determinant [Dokdonella sp.]|uniref:XrtA system polysaccharide chain length determinant n=1 Tax=Dokdonella sp. TaxID=2291710 RepID=UPI00261A07EA|nr:XrtA system polysaccharide chain length determinant [Dokdonella sp.]